MNRTKHARRRRAGFSMLEMTLVIAIMGILMTVAAIAFLPTILTGKEQATKTTMHTVSAALDQYKARNNVYPQTLAALAPDYIKNPPRDGWKREFYFRVPGAAGRPYDLVSAGDDGVFETADDVDWAIVQRE